MPIKFDTPIPHLVLKRFSCRNYLNRPIARKTRLRLDDFISRLPAGPFGTQPRFSLVAASEDDRVALRSLGTYGFIRGATGFIIGAATPEGKYLEDYGYLMEAIILKATDLGLGTCWLGGTFTKGSFSRKIGLASHEEIPAVTSIGYSANPMQGRKGIIQQIAKSQRRRPWECMFWQERFGNPLTPQEAGSHATPLEMVRLGPSASNKQPWQILQSDGAWHFYLRRTDGYREGFFQRLLDLCDLQRLDMGIAMCHFELTARGLGLRGQWRVEEPEKKETDTLSEYIASWVPET